MSKYFKALENAERERATHGEPRPPAPAVTTSVEERPEPPETRAPAPPAGEPVKVVTVTPSSTVTVRPVPQVEARPAPPPYGAPLLAEPFGRRAPERAVDSLLFHGTGELDEHLISVLQPTSVAAEHYRAARLYLETLRRERGLGLIAISSARRGDGKTLTALNLAGTLAQATNTRVALVEVDMRRPAVAQALGMSNARGLSAYLLENRAEIDSLLERPPGIGFTVLLAGPPVAMPYELLKSPRLRELFARLRERFDHIIVDTPPALPFPDVGILRDLVDGFLMVVRAQRTPREMVQEALTALGPELALGVIFNDFNDEERLAATAAYGTINMRAR